MENGAKMEPWGTPNASQNRPQKSNKRSIKGTPSQDPSKGGFWEGFGWIWGAFWEGFGWIWEPWGVQMDMKINTFRWKVTSFPQDPLKEGFGEGSGRVWGDLGRVSEGFPEDFLVNLVMANPIESFRI